MAFTVNVTHTSTYILAERYYDAFLLKQNDGILKKHKLVPPKM